jgi:hypothetical protein
MTKHVLSLSKGAGGARGISSARCRKPGLAGLACPVAGRGCGMQIPLVKPRSRFLQDTFAPLRLCECLGCGSERRIRAILISGTGQESRTAWTSSQKSGKRSTTEFQSGVLRQVIMQDLLKHPKTQPIIWLTAAVSIAAALLIYGLFESANYEKQAKANVREFSGYTSDKVAEACVGIPQIERVNCLHNAMDAQTEFTYNQADLVAQRQSALWAYIMAAAASIGIILSAGGVWLVYKTFKETKRNTDLIIEQARAFVSFSGDVSGKITLSQDAIFLNFYLENSGQTAAQSIALVIRLTLIGMNGAETENHVSMRLDALPIGSRFRLVRGVARDDIQGPRVLSAQHCLLKVTCRYSTFNRVIEFDAVFTSHGNPTKERSEFEISLIGDPPVEQRIV